MLQADRLAALRLPRDEDGPVFAEPWQAEAFALAVTLSQRGHFTWPEWAATLADELRAAAARGEPDDGTRYYEHWLAALERLVTDKGLADPAAIQARKAAWIDAYRHTPHGRPVELRPPPATAAARWLVIGLATAGAAYWLLRQAASGSLADGGTVVPEVGWLAGAGLGSLLGMRHALEPDHLAAVSTLVTGERSSAKAAWLGACWGLGHTLTLLAAGAVLVVWRTEMPAGAAEVFELGVVLLLVGFGVRAIHQGVYRGPTGPTHTHATPGRGRRADLGGWTSRATAARRRRPRTRRQRGAHRAGRRDAALDARPAQLPGAVRPGDDRGHGSAIGTGRLAARPRGRPSVGRAQPLGGGGRRVDGARPRLGLPARRAAGSSRASAL